MEGLLHSKIATTSNLDLLRRVVSKPEEELWKYVPLKKPFKTTLYQTIEDEYGDMECLRDIFTFSLEATSSLGPYCADSTWVDALAKERLPHFHGKITAAYKRLGPEIAAAKTDHEIQKLNRLSQMVREHELPSGSDMFEQLSQKVQIFHRNLGKRFEEDPNTKCIVFTKQRRTASLLSIVFDRLPIPYVRSGVLVGIRSGDHIGMNSSYHQQFKTMIQFRKGELNCLVSH